MTPNGTRLLMLIHASAAHVRPVNTAASRGNWRIIQAKNAEDAINLLGTHDGMSLDAVLLCDDSGNIALIAEIRARRPALPVLICTAHAEEGIESLRAGANDYLLQPINSHKILFALEAVHTHKGAQGELRPLSDKLDQSLGFGAIVGAAPAFRAALAIAAKAARARIPVLIEGEKGVGKQMIATAIHMASPRAKKHLVTVDCAGQSAVRLDSYLFGHEQGAFTGAFERQIGECVAADCGTLFIKNIHLLPPALQVKLLHLAMNGEVLPQGARTGQAVDVRLIVTASPGLNEMAKSGRFREDLFSILNTVHVALPTLYERREDIPALVRHFLAQIARLPNMQGIGITESAMDALTAYAWPSNVRQLQNVLLRAAIQCEGDALTAADFPNILAQTRRTKTSVPFLTLGAGGVTLFNPDGHMRPLEAIEADVIRLAIGHYRGRMTEVARRLGIGRSTLYRKLVELGISDAA